MSPGLINHPLTRADGSTTFSSNLFTVLAAVNGPIEVQRRDELPEEAAIEVNIRPSAGVGGPRERWLESIIASLLRSLLLVHMHPRTLIQVTLQITKQPSLKIKKGIADVAIIPALANAAFLALVDSMLPLEKTMISALGVIQGDGTLVIDPTEKELIGYKSAHAMVFSTHGELLLNESTGQIDVSQWQNVALELRKSAMEATAPAMEAEAMLDGDAEAAAWMRRTLEGDVSQAIAWREAG